MTIPVANGGCLCASVRYRVLGEPLAQSFCYCKSCRLASGAPSVAWIVVRRVDFEWVKAEPARYRSSPAVVRTFCGKCGTPMTYQHDDGPDTIDVTTATLDHPEAFPPSREVWLEHKLPWEPSGANLERFQQGRT
jgi:hypothetical protein